ncbi:hypothetical protein JCM33374_g9 [Metschnikowia sp. JCM 33374]|nr:hypothetical protein JCM33374_g9 [Metschnikowia sp. JCM 33374]
MSAKENSSASDSSQLLTQDSIQAFMNTDGALEVLLTRLKQSLNTGDEISKYVKRKAMIEDEHYGSLKKYSANLRTNMKASKSIKNDTFSRRFDSIVEFDEKLYSVGSSYVAALNVMHDELVSLMNTVSRTRKTIKDECKRKEKECSDAILLAEKARQKYYHLCDDLEKLKTSDPNKKSFLKNKTAEQQEDELQRKVDAADQDYKSKVSHCRKIKDEILMIHRPTHTKKLKNLILELDIAMNVQLQKFATWSETLVMNSGVMIAPLQNEKSSMKSLAADIDNELDLYNYLVANSKSSTNKSLVPVDYIAHPSFAKGPQPAKPFFNSGSASKSANTPDTPSGNTVKYPSMESSKQGSDLLTSSSTAPYTDAAGNPSSYSYNSLDPATDELKGPRSLNSVNPYSQPTFGASIEDVIQFAGIDNVPLVVKRCIDVVENYGLDIEGVYRTSGNKTTVQSLKESIDSNFANYLLIGNNIDPENVLDADIYCTASLLKLYFTCLPEPLLTADYYQSFIDTVKSNNELNIAKKLHHLVYNLPDGAYFTLRSLIFHLNRVAANESANRMSTKSLSIIWGPVILCDQLMSPQDLSYKSKVVEELMLIANEIFETD